MHVTFLEFSKNVVGYFPFFYSALPEVGWAQVVYTYTATEPYAQWTSISHFETPNPGRQLNPFAFTYILIFKIAIFKI